MPKEKGLLLMLLATLYTGVCNRDFRDDRVIGKPEDSIQMIVDGIV